MLTPVLIGGVPRSGTTLLGNLLGAAEECTCTPESEFLVALLTGKLPLSTKADALETLRYLRNHKTFLFWEMESYSIVSLEKFLDDPSPTSLISLLVESYAEFLGKQKPRFWIDHTPSNLRYTGRWKKAFPNAKFIHIVRDGRAVANSIMKLDWGPSTVIGSAKYWHREVSRRLTVEKLFGEKELLRVHYEVLLQDPEGELKRICDFAGIVFQLGMLKPGLNFELPEYTSGQHEMVSKRPDPTRINAWQRDLSGIQKERFEIVGGELLEKLGYQRQSSWKSRKLTSLEKLLSSIYEGTMKRVNRKRKRRRERKALADYLLQR